jgi:catechol 2,3-dioxygenase-like lactoylglutathione lyase family enzyme
VTTSGDEPFTPRLNHVAIRVDPALLDERGRAEILDFYGDVFGWTEGDNTGERNDPLIMYTGTFGQFVYLAKGDPDSGASAVEHFGLQVATLDELEEIVERARARAVTDDRVRVTDVHARTTRGPAVDYTLTSAYIGYVLPFTVELQHIARHELTTRGR